MSIQKKLIGLTILVAAGFGDYGVSVAEEPARPAPAQSVAQLSKGGLNPTCASQVWPYVAAECLASKDGQPARKVSRVIGASER